MEINSPQKMRVFQRLTIGQYILLGVGLVLAIAIYVFLNGFVACWRLTSLPGIPLPACSSASGSSGAAGQSGTPGVGSNVTPTPSVPQIELPEPWDGASRVTILLIGLDYRDWESGQGAPHSDTMMLLTLDPLTRTAGMLSITRDMWVNIPGFGYNRINTAYKLGEEYNLPGGGMGLAMKTVENFLGIDIQYYARVDFTTFEDMIDTIGGVCLEIPEEIVIDPLGPHNTETLEAGPDCLNGAETLAYARARHTANDDIDRAGRQQQVILAIRDKVLSSDNFLNLVAQAPTLYNELSSGIDTNLSLDDMLRLAVFVKDISLDQIQEGVIDYTMSAPGQVVVDGETQDIVKPYPDKIRELVDQIFGSGSMKPMATGDATQLMQQEAAKVLIVNGSGVDGIASKTAEYLTAQGMNVTGYGNMSEYPDSYTWPPLPDRTMLIVHMGKPYVMKYLMALMEFDSQSQLVVDFDPEAAADVVLVLGADWAYDNPMP